MPEDLVAESDPAAKARRAFEGIVGEGVDPAEALVALNSREARAALGIDPPPTMPEPQPKPWPGVQFFLDDEPYEPPAPSPGRSRVGGRTRHT